MSQPLVSASSSSQQPLPTTTLLQNEQQVIRQAGKDAIRIFLESNQCFAILRTSGKIVVFDTRIPIQLAFYALVEHDMLVAPLWDPSKCQFVGLLTVTDFIDVLLHYRNTQKNVESLATQSIADILQDSNVALRPFQAAEAECTLWQACKILLHSKNSNIHSRVSTATDFLPIVYTEDMRVLACITFTNILEHLVKHFREQRRLFDDTLADLGIGTYENLVTVAPSQTLADALERMQQHNLSAIPVVDDQGKIAGVYSRSDITFLTKATDADDAVRNLSLPLHELLAQARQDVTTPDALFTCSPTHTLQSIFESFADMHFHRLFVVDAEERLVGVVSARDLVQYLVPDDA